MYTSFQNLEASVVIDCIGLSYQIVIYVLEMFKNLQMLFCKVTIITWTKIIRAN